MAKIFKIFGKYPYGKNGKSFHQMIFFRAPAGKYGLDLKGSLFLGGAPHFPKLLPYKAGFKGDT